MAKRKRLSPARPDFLTMPAPQGAAPASVPIAQVTADAAAAAALRDLSEEMRAAREEGRMVLSLPLSDIRAEHLERDRAYLDPEAQAALIESLRARGQQTPIEVQALADGSYGLISGWRRYLALQSLFEETGEARFGQVLALLRQPEDQAQAYVAMVEENEVRANLSYFERARIVRRAVETGVFETEKQALQRLFSTASYPRRSKIKSFLTLVDALGDALRFPARIPERTGLALTRRLAQAPQDLARLRALLLESPCETPEDEARLLARFLRDDQSLKPGLETVVETEKDSPAPSGSRLDSHEVVPGIRMAARPGRLELEGPGINAGLIDRLQDWLRSQG